MAHLCRILVFALIITEKVSGSGDNVTDSYVRMETKDFQTRQNRLLTFNTQEGGDINVELAFNVPFISIPVKKSIESAKGAVANLNIGAVALAGAMALGVAVIVPAVFLFMSKKMYIPNSTTTNSNNNQQYSGYRSDDQKPQEWWKVLSLLDQALSDNNMDTTTCFQRMVCWTVKNSAQNVSKGHSSSSDKIIDGVATNKWLQQIVDGTAIHAAIQNGLSNANCSKEYSHCKITQKSLHMLAKQFVNTINNRK